LQDALLGRLQLGEVAHHLLLTGELDGELVDALLHNGETARYRFELIQIGRRSGWRDHVGSGLRNGFGLRSQPTKLRVRVRYHLSGRVAVGLPSQGGSNADAKRDQEAGARSRGSLGERWPFAREPVMFQVGRAKGGLNRWLGGSQTIR
jgi:hypothetical protein